MMNDMQPPSGQSAAPVEAWMNPETLDVIHADRKAAWENEYGAGGVSKAAGYTVAMTRAQPAAATVTTDAQAIRDAALEEAAAAVEQHDRTGRSWVPDSLWGNLTREAAGRIRALKGNSHGE